MRGLLVLALLAAAAVVFAWLVVGWTATCPAYGARLECAGAVCWCER